MARQAQILALLLLAGFASSARAEEPGWPDRLRVVYLPAEGRDATLQRFAPVSDYLASMLGMPVESLSFDSYEQTFAHLTTGRFDVAYLSPSSYCQALPWIGLQVLAMELDPQAGRGYYSLLICRRGEGGNLQNFRDRRLAFSDVGSTSGFLVPLHHFLHDLHRTPGMFAGEVQFAGNHRAVVEGILNKTYDLGAVNTIDLARSTPNGVPAGIDIVWKSDLLPGSPICARGDLPEGLAATIEVLLFTFNADPGRVGRIKTGGFGPACAADYRSVRALEDFRP